MKKILRVFPEKTSYTPIDKMTRIGFQTLALPKHDEIHISICFTWDIEIGHILLKQYGAINPQSFVGGPAFGTDNNKFILGRYTRLGVTFTSRGCDFNCPWCLVRKREGNFRELNAIADGNIIQDNNILLSSKKHLRKVFEMLRTQKNIEFKGGLDTRLLKDWHIEELRNLKVSELWLALDEDHRTKSFQKACGMLKSAGFNSNQIRCYVMAGYNEPITNAEERLKFAYKQGAMPFIQVYQKPSDTKRLASEQGRVACAFVRNWSRPAIIKARMKKEGL